jgi:hypothetical protein
MLDMWWTNWHWGRFYPSTVVYPANSSSGTVGQLVANVPSGLSLTPPQEIKKTTGIWNETVMIKSRYYPGVLLRKTEETHENPPEYRYQATEIRAESITEYGNCPVANLHSDFMMKGWKADTIRAGADTGTVSP